MKTRTRQSRPLSHVAGLVLCSALVLGACSSNDDSDDSAMDSETSDLVDEGTGTGELVDESENTDETIDESGNTDELVDETTNTDESVSYAFASAATPTFDAGQIERITIGDTREVTGTYPTTESDIRVSTDGTDAYQIGRFDIDSITRFTSDDLVTPVYQYSVLQGDTSPNTFGMAFVNETKAYVIQFGGTEVLIVNPSAQTAEEFITGSLDISAYDEDAPNASSAVVVDGKLFVLLARLTGFSPVNPGYVVVFDTETDEEINTTMDEEGLKGIALSTLNATTLQYVESSNDILVNGSGNLNDLAEEGTNRYTGGIEAIDVDDFSVELLLDDGTEEDNNGFFFGSIQATDTRGYVISSAGYQTNTLRSYNVSTGLFEDGIVAGLEGVDLTTLAIGPSGLLWVGLGGTEPGFVLINPEDNAEVERIATEFIPNSVVFTEGAN